VTTVSACRRISGMLFTYSCIYVRPLPPSARTRAHAHVHTRTHMHAHAYKRTHTRTHIQTHPHTHAHIPTKSVQQTLVLYGLSWTHHVYFKNI